LPYIDRYAIWQDSLWRNVRHAARALGRAPGFTAATVVTLAVGIGCSTLLFSVFDALLLRPLPYARPEGLVVVTPDVSPIFWSVIDQLRASKDVFGELGVCVPRAANIMGGGEAERALVARVDQDFLRVLGVSPAIGRAFRLEEFEPAHDKVALLTDTAWRRRYAASRDVVGRFITIDGQPYTIVGVLPREFRTPSELTSAREVWFDSRVGLLLPLSARPRAWDPESTDQIARGATIVGRLRPGTPLNRGQALVGLVTDREMPPAAPPFSLVPLRDAVAGSLPRQLGILAAAVGVLLLVACANAGNLLLERLYGRRAEMAVRAALGASSGQLIGTVLTETVVVAIVGGAGAMLVVWAGSEAVQTLAAPVITGLDAVGVNVRVFTFAAALSVGTGLLVGVVPAIRLSHADISRSLNLQAAAPRVPGRLAVPSALVVLQVAVSVVLIVCGALLAREFIRSLPTDLGYRTHGVLSAEISLDRFRHRDRDRAPATFFADLLERAANLPGVLKAGLVSHVPGGESVGVTRMRVEGFAETFTTDVATVSEDYFTLLSIPMLTGRPFERHDTADAPHVVVVNEAFAAKYWDSAERALNRQVGFGTFGTSMSTIVGVVANTRDAAQDWKKGPVVYWNYRQASLPSPQMTLLLLARSGDGRTLALPLTRLVRGLDPNQPLYNVLTLEHIAAARFARPRLMLATMTTFGIVTLLLAAVGVHGVMAYGAALRRREIGIRLALGGTPRAIVAMMLRRGAKLVSSGIAVGLPVAIAVGWFLQSELFDLGMADLTLFVAAASVALAAGLIASLSPALRAVRVDPIATLRSE
jgi:predicted permease